MVFDSNRLCGRIVEKFGTRSAFASAMGMPDSALSYRLNGKTGWGTDEIHRAIQPDMLDIPLEELGEYFFKPKVL